MKSASRIDREEASSESVVRRIGNVEIALSRLTPLAHKEEFFPKQVVESLRRISGLLTEVSIRLFIWITRAPATSLLAGYRLVV
jgi:hypothetical protein